MKRENKIKSTINDLDTEWLASAEFVVNNKVHIATKVSPFMANYERELRMGENIRKKVNVVATTHHSRTNDLIISKALQWAIK